MIDCRRHVCVLLQRGCGGDRPPMYQLWLFPNKDIPLDDIKLILKECFYIQEYEMCNLLEEASVYGGILCGIYPGDVAETKVQDMINNNKIHQHKIHLKIQRGT